ncbi:MAG TPA: hypothetical protein VFZ53_26950 [Polyangiaceae bacterium]
MTTFRTCFGPMLVVLALGTPNLARAQTAVPNAPATDEIVAEERAAQKKALAEAEARAEDDPEMDLEGLGEEKPPPPPGYLPGHGARVGIGLSPHAPGQQSVLPGGMMPAFGAPLEPKAGGRLDFAGYLQAGARAGFNSRQTPERGQGKTVWHGDPIVPRGNVFENTNNVPYSWAELRFSYSIPGVTSTVSLGAWEFSQTMKAAGSFMPNAQLWIRDAFLAYTPRGLDPVKLSWKVGVYEDRYGAMAQYSTGQYGAPIVATIAGVGETLSVGVPLGESLGLELEHGIKTNMTRPPADIPTGPPNNWPKPWEGQTFVNHAHVAFDIQKGFIKPAFHFIDAVARDDQGDDVSLGSLRAGYQSYTSGVPEDHPELDHADGSLRVLGADVRFGMNRFGYLVVGASHTTGEHVRTVNGVVQVLNSGGGRDLMDRYFGRNNDQGRGTLLLAGFEYNVSLGELLRYPEEFYGEGPDLKLSIFGQLAHITADDPARDGEDKYKYGVEGVYTPLSWLGASARIDRAVPYVSRPEVPLYPNQNDNTFSVVTLKAIFKSDWQAREALTLQYSRFFYRDDFHLVTLNSGGQVSNQTDQPDENLLALYGTLWW